MIQFIALAGLLSLILLLAGCPDTPPPVTPDAPPTSTDARVAEPLAVALPSDSVALSHGHTLEHIDIGDLDGDGRLDVTLAAHVEGVIETYYQLPNRQFRASGPLADPGFHPNGTLTMLGSDGAGYLVLNAETLNVIRSYRGVAGGAALQVGNIPARAPFTSIAVNWPGWGRVLATMSKTGGKLQLTPNFDPAKPLATESVAATVTAKDHYRLAGLTAADIQGQGVPAILITVPRQGTIAAISPLDFGQVKVDKLWDLGRGASPEAILPLDFNRDGHLDLFVLGQLLPEALLLLNDGLGGFVEHRFPIGDPALFPGVRAGAITRDADGTQILWTSLDTALGVNLWRTDGNATPERVILERFGRDPIRFATGDLDADGHEDLVMGSSVGSLPVTVFYGPLEPKVAAIGTWLAGLQAQQAARQADSSQSWSLLDQK